MATIENPMQGKRIYPDADGHVPILQPGEYLKSSDTRWEVCVPTGVHGAIHCGQDGCTVQEH